VKRLADVRADDRVKVVDLGADGGAFLLAHPRTGVDLRVIASDGGGWDHVSVSLPNRCPNWVEMEATRRAFFDDDETVIQIHPPLTDYVNCHPHTLHLWRPQNAEIPRPPAVFVGPK